MATKRTNGRTYNIWFTDKNGAAQYAGIGIFGPVYVSRFEKVEAFSTKSGGKGYRFDVPVYGQAWNLNRAFQDANGNGPFDTNDEGAIYLHCTAFCRQGDGGSYRAGDSLERAMKNAREHGETSFRAVLMGQMSVNQFTDKTTGKNRISGVNITLDEIWPVYNVQAQTQGTQQTAQANGFAAAPQNGFAQVPAAPQNGFAQAPAPQAAPATYQAPAAQAAPATYQAPAPQAAPATYQAPAPQAAPATYQAPAPQAAPATYQAPVPQAPAQNAAAVPPVPPQNSGFQTAMPGVTAVPGQFNQLSYSDADLPF